MVGIKELAKYSIRTLWILLSNLYCIPTYLGLLALLFPIYLASPILYNQVEQVLFSWLLSLVACWSWSAGYQVVESGDRLDDVCKHRLLLMANHQSTADVPILMTTFSSRIGFCNKVMWIMDRIFKFTNFGIVSWMHDDFFILAGKANRDYSLVDLKEHLKNVFLVKKRKYLVLFPEGGFLRKRKSVSQAFAKKKDLPNLEHCTVPRTGALDVILDNIGPREDDGEVLDHIEKVVDVTLAYPEGRPLDMQSIVTGWREQCTTHIHYRVFDSKHLASLTSEERFAWMVQLYKEKDEMLEKYYQTGKFPYDQHNPDAAPPTIIRHDPLRFIVLHLFFLFSSYVFYSLVWPVLALF